VTGGDKFRRLKAISKIAGRARCADDPFQDHFRLTNRLTLNLGLQYAKFNLLADPSISNANHNQLEHPRAVDQRHHAHAELHTRFHHRMRQSRLATAHRLCAAFESAAFAQYREAPSLDMLIVKRFHIVERVSADFRL
jgi:hypothetical protein